MTSPCFGWFVPSADQEMEEFESGVLPVYRDVDEIPIL